jgi:hypothetical protein
MTGPDPTNLKQGKKGRLDMPPLFFFARVLRRVTTGNIINRKGHKDHKATLAVKSSSLWSLCSSWLDLPILQSDRAFFAFEEKADNGIILC